MSSPVPTMDSILSAIPHLQRGPGGVAAIIKNGEVVAKRAWGYADLDRRIPMQTSSVFPICSISKQMVCLAMVSLLREPTPLMKKKSESPEQQMDAELRKLLPHLFKHDEASSLTVKELANMQSGIRDYWAMTTLWGARPDDAFSMTVDADQTLARTKSFHFSPGTQFSYSNVNFHVLGRVLENVSGYSLAQVLVDRLFIPAGMSTAALCPNTNGLPRPVRPYEGNESLGYFKALNRIEWAGDAGIAASLEDMIAYEQYLDRSWSDPNSLYAHTAQQQHFKDGTPTDYGYGLGRSQVAGKTAIRHGGALRGFRMHRAHIPSERLSAVVLLNFEADAGSACDYIFKKILDYKDPEETMQTPADSWYGDFLDDESQLSVAVTKADKPGTIAVRYSITKETVRVTSEFEAESKSTKIRLDGDTLHVKRIADNRDFTAKRIKKLNDLQLYNAPSADFTGTYHSAESDSTFICTGDAGTLYASFDGFIGRGPVWLMRYVGQDTWIMGNPRGLDATPPGDWTIVFKRGDGGKISGCTVGCWLAHNVDYAKKS